MSKSNKVIIIGAGLGGVATSVFLAKNGYEVEVFEKNADPGGRCGQLIRNGYRFDLGATMLIMPSIYKKIFKLLDIQLFEKNDVFLLDEIYKIHFDDNTALSFSTDTDKMHSQLEMIEKGSFEKSQKYIKKGYRIFQLAIEKIIDRNYTNLFQIVNIKNAGFLIKLKAHISNYYYVKKFFKNKHLRMAYTFQNIYVGQSPFNSPALFSMVPAAELTEGSYFPKGGMFAIIKMLIEKAKELGVKFHYNSPVEKIIIEEKLAKGILLQNKKEFNADIVVANADLPYVYRNLLPKSHSSTRIDNLKYSCSAICFHWGLDKSYHQLGHHNVFLSDDYRNGLKKIFKDKSVNDNPSFYLHSPVKTDPTAAPEGHDALSVIVGAGHIDKRKKQDWQKVKKKVRKAVIRRLKQFGLDDIEEHIKYEACYLPGTWESTCNITRGSVFGSVSHNLLQMTYFRPQNRHRKYKNLFFVGGSTHPGNGIPNILLSAKLTSERILKKKF